MVEILAASKYKLLQFFAEIMIQVQAKYTCEVGQENNEYHQRRWVLPYKDPCQCSNIRYGGVNAYSLKRSFKPVYAETPMVGDNIGEIRDHYDMNCIGKKNVVICLTKTPVTVLRYGMEAGT